MRSFVVAMTIFGAALPAQAQETGVELLAKATMQRAYACSLWAASSLILHYPQESLYKIAEVSFDACPYEWLAYDSAQRIKIGGGGSTPRSATAQVLRELSIPQIVKIINDSKGSSDIATRMKIIEQANKLQREFKLATQ